MYKLYFSKNLLVFYVEILEMNFHEESRMLIFWSLDLTEKVWTWRPRWDPPAPATPSSTVGIPSIKVVRIGMAKSTKWREKNADCYSVRKKH